MRLITKIIVEKELGNIWATPEDLFDMSDADIIELVQEDLLGFLEDAKFKVDRKWEFELKGGYDKE